MIYKNVTKFAFNCIFFYPGCFKSGLYGGEKTKTKQIIFKKKQKSNKNQEKTSKQKILKKNTKNKNKNEKERKQKYVLVMGEDCLSCLTCVLSFCLFEQ